MVLTIIIVACLLIVGLTYFLYHRYDFVVSAVISACMGFIVGLMIVITFIGWMMSISSATSEYNKMMENKRGLEFAVQNFTAYTDKFELANSELFNNVKKFNSDLSYRQAKSHNIVTGWFITDWADDIEPIDYEIIMNGYNEMNPNINIIQNHYVYDG